MPELKIPAATYRLQFNSQFRFEDAIDLVPYLYRLGITDLYASPILKARKGSQHGYDVTDPTCLNPELGTGMVFDALVQRLSKHKMGLLLDIVPNHMAASPESIWWTDVLENGLCSPYARLFDIEWGAFNNRILLPILNRPYEKALRNQELLLSLDNSGFCVEYEGFRLPLDVRSYRLVIACCLNNLDEMNPELHRYSQELNQVKVAIENLPPVTSLCDTEAARQYHDRQAVKESFLGILKRASEIMSALVQNIVLFNSKTQQSRDFELMHNLLEQQVYQLEYWKTAYRHLNYRRFFDINDLIGVRVEKSQVFRFTHSLILDLVRQRKVSGLRIDHMDGLNDPLQYLLRLQQHIMPKQKGGSTRRFYIIVEKILTSDEVLSPEWPVFGTTGYDFIDIVNAVLVEASGLQTLGEIYHQLIGSQADFDNIVYQKKKQVMEELFPSEMSALTRHLACLAQQYVLAANLSYQELNEALTDVTGCLPVYRTYTRTFTVTPRDRFYLKRAVEQARRCNPSVDSATLDFLKSILTLNFPSRLSSEQKKTWFQFVLRWQQFSGAVMAKGLEDTALYCYNRLISLNEVGVESSSPNLSVDDFHRRVLTRQKTYPHTFNTSSTHDTKMSEDVRARLNVLSEIPEAWKEHLTQWLHWNKVKKRLVKGLPVPEPNMEILLYQTMLGAWPLYEKELAEFQERLKKFVVKAVREAKTSTSWLSPNLEYESAFISFLESVLDGSKENHFLEDFLILEKQIAYYGAFSSLAQLLLKISSPGVPDFYQGTELWDFSLVDPDNRRKVDFKRRVKLLAELARPDLPKLQPYVQGMLDSWQDGRVKLYVTYKALNVRRSHSEVFQDGEYIPLQILGQKQEHVCAFARHGQHRWALIVVPRVLTRIVPVGAIPLGQSVWTNDLLLLPDRVPKHWRNIFTGERLEISRMKSELRISDILCTFPVALLIST
jgi:(1->4)-alpha-D-glucan 1-alpha-D-glucosylmutase